MVFGGTTCFDIGVGVHIAVPAVLCLICWLRQSCCIFPRQTHEPAPAHGGTEPAQLVQADVWDGWPADWFWTCTADTVCDLNPEVFPDRALDPTYQHRHFHMLPVYDRWNAVVGAVLRSERDAIVHVGPSDLPTGEEIHFYQKVVANGGRTVVLVEPDPLAFVSLQGKIREVEAVRIHGEHMSRFHVVNAAMCPDTQGHLPFYVASDAVSSLPEFADQVAQHFSTLDADKLLRTLQKYSDTITMDDHVREVEVRCVTPRSLFEEVAISPERVGMLIVDAEGFDAELVRRFFAVEGLAPATVQFEWVMARDYELLLEVVQMLSTRGYDVYRHGLDVFALRAHAAA